MIRLQTKNCQSCSRADVVEEDGELEWGIGVLVEVLHGLQQDGLQQDEQYQQPHGRVEQGCHLPVEEHRAAEGYHRRVDLLEDLQD